MVYDIPTTYRKHAWHIHHVTERVLYPPLTKEAPFGSIPTCKETKACMADMQLLQSKKVVWGVGGRLAMSM